MEEEEAEGETSVGGRKGESEEEKEMGEGGDEGVDGSLLRMRRP